MADLRDADGYLPIEDYGVIGDGRSVALVGRDGSIDWWGAPNIDSPPVFDRLLDAQKGGRFWIRPAGEFQATHRYEDKSNVLVTTFKTDSGSIRITDSMNSGAAGRLPWTELGRRVECINGSVDVAVTVSFSTEADAFLSVRERVYESGALTVAVVSSNDAFADGTTLSMRAGDRLVVGLLAAEGEPLTVPSADAIDERIGRSNNEWKKWSAMVKDDGPYGSYLIRSLLALKLLLYSPSGAIAASATMGLPERIGGEKNYDYRFAWVRDTAYTIKAMIRSGLTEEVHAALSWLIRTVDHHGVEVFYTLMGQPSDGTKKVSYEGYKQSAPVTIGNQASGQLQLSLYGDIIETVYLYATDGNYLDARTRLVVAKLANDCAKKWHKKDAGIWELEESRHYTISKIGCWLALDRAVKLYDEGYLTGTGQPESHRAAWARERDKIAAYIERRCWSKKQNSYTWYAGSKGVDASLMLATRFGYPNKDRLQQTLQRIERELKHGAYVYRYSGAENEEGAFTACAFWLVEGYAFLGHGETARTYMDQVLQSSLNGLGLSSEMADPSAGNLLGNMPQGLSHLTLIHAIDAIESN